MKVIRTVNEMVEIATSVKANDQTIGFVPTMGYLHDGHAKLIDQCRKESQIVIVSIFVNPLQFGPNEDFERYPRDEKRDCMIAESHGVDYIFIPSVEEMYRDNSSIKLQVVERTNVLCGRSRAGHFDGVVTVLAKLFHITKADLAFFGMKDAQQIAVVKAFVDDLNFSVKIRPVPTIREDDGLARSSRNVYLSQQERADAASLYSSLKVGQHLIIDGEKNPVMIIDEVKKNIHRHTNGTIDYVEILSYPDLKAVTVINQQIIIAIAVNFQKARLIDNLVINEHGIIVRDPFE
ncbi:pantoate--beta-alanine ligase [Gracilibacillus oryzae]|uniref:Pantothenate synthetase n=1 Tax=Gracilibacillus oryzae TaxID=1672701 RepID=A0A7C8GVY0_9BACI|nr:pantoate--beta-alanine ligase [Gracilibacillus oryzae]KAB8138460.1 pantoate--beta-alanine ligase [Gracilibacillus oryzae]